MRRLSLVLLCLAAAAGSLSAQTHKVARIQTPQGEIRFVLSDLTPRHKESFIKLAGQHYWDSLTFNRVIKNFVAQGGCPDAPAGFAGSPYNLAPEFNDSLKHVYGAVGAGHDGNKEKLSAGCQFYIVANPKGEARLNGNFTVYGQVYQGMDVVEKIVSTPKDSTDQPLTPVTLKIDVIDVKDSELKKAGARLP